MRHWVVEGNPGLEGPENVVDFLADARALHIGDMAAAAIGDARFRDLGVADRIVRGDVLRPHHAGDQQLADLVIDAHFLPPGNGEIAIRHAPGDHRRDGQVDRLLPGDRAIAAVRAGRAETGQRGGIDRIIEELRQRRFAAEEIVRLLSSEAERARLVEFCTLALSEILMFTVRMSPGEAARGSPKKVWRPGVHSELVGEAS